MIAAVDRDGKGTLTFDEFNKNFIDFWSLFDKIRSQINNFAQIVFFLWHSKFQKFRFRFADLVYAPYVQIGHTADDARDRQVRHVTDQLIKKLIDAEPKIGNGFILQDPDLKYMVDKGQFRRALGHAVSHVSEEAMDFLWCAQFTDADNSSSPDPVDQEIYSKVISAHTFFFLNTLK